MECLTDQLQAIFNSCFHCRRAFQKFGRDRQQWEIRTLNKTDTWVKIRSKSSKTAQVLRNLCISGSEVRRHTFRDTFPYVRLFHWLLSKFKIGTVVRKHPCTNSFYKKVKKIPVKSLPSSVLAAIKNKRNLCETSWFPTLVYGVVGFFRKPTNSFHRTQSWREYCSVALGQRAQKPQAHASNMHSLSRYFTIRRVPIPACRCLAETGCIASYEVFQSRRCCSAGRHAYHYGPVRHEENRFIPDRFKPGHSEAVERLRGALVTSIAMFPVTWCELFVTSIEERVYNWLD